MSFTGHPDLRHLDDGVNAVLLAPLYYQDVELGQVIAPSGMMTDGGSIPKIFQNIVSPWGKGLRAFIIHDALYKYQWFSKDDSDRCLWRMLKEINEPSLEANVIYDAVKLGGQEAWDAATKIKEAQNAGPIASDAKP